MPRNALLFLAVEVCCFAAIIATGNSWLVILASWGLIFWLIQERS